MADIININEPWDGQHDGNEVEKFIKQQLVALKTIADGKVGCIVYSSGRIEFYQDESKTVKIGEVVLSGIVYNVEITASEESTFNVLASDTSKTLTFSAKSYSSPIGQTVMTPFVEDYTYVVSVDNGTGTFTEKQSGSFRQTDEVSLQIRPWLTTGENRIRLSVTGKESGQQSVKIFTANVTTLTLTVAMKWWKPWLEGSAYEIDGIKFSGNLQKTLYVAIDNDSTIVDPIQFLPGTNYTTSEYKLDITQYFPDMEDSGIHTIDVWMEGGGVRTATYHFNVMCVKAGDRKPLIAINDIKAKASNYVSETLFQYALYNATGVTFDTYATDGSVTVHKQETISGIETQRATPYTSYVEMETDVMVGLTLTVVANVSTAEGTAQQTVALPLDNSTAFVPTPFATFYLNAANRNNGSADRETFINQATTGGRAAEYAATWQNFAWGTTDGWVTDGTNKALAVLAGCHISVPGLKMLSGTTEGNLTVELKFKSENIADYDTPVLTFAQTVDGKPCGIFLYPTRLEVLATSAQNSTLQRIGLQEGEVHHITIVFQKNYDGKAGQNLCSIYMNGCRNIHFSYDGEARFGDGSLEIGQSSTDFYLYMMRFYEPVTGGSTGVLSSQDVLANFINTIVDGDEFTRAGVKESNDIIDNGTVDYEMAKKRGCNIMIVETDDDLPSVDYPATEGKTCTLRLWYGSDTDERNFSVTNAGLSGQGTTSMQYYRWNLRFKGKDSSIWTYADNTTSTGKKGWFDGKNAHPKVADIVAKKNYASAMQGHKMGSVEVYDDLYKKVVSTTGLPEGARVAVYQYPVLGFQKFSDGTYQFIGLYTVGPHKGDKGTFGYDGDAYPSLMSLEGPNHAPLGTRFLHAWQNVDYDYAHETLTFGGEEGWDADFIAGVETDSEADHDAVLALYESEWRPAYEQVFFCSQYLVSIADTGMTLAEINADVNTFRQGTTDGMKNNLVQLYDTGYNLYAYNNASKAYVPVSHSMLTYLHDYLGGVAQPTAAQLRAARAAKFRAEASNYWETKALLFHYCFCVLIGATDNFAKNMYPFKFQPLSQGGRWSFRQDDLDSILDTDNNGQQTKRYSCMPGDVNGDGVQIFQGGDSALWKLVEVAFADRVITNMSELVTAAMSVAAEKGISGATTHERLFNLFAYYYWSHSAKYFPQEAYNEDTEWSYIEPWRIDPSKQYNNVWPLTQARGDAQYSEREWVTKHIAFLFSHYGIGGFAGSSQEMGQFAFTPIAPYTFNIVPAIDLCPTMVSGGGTTIKGALTRAGEVCPLYSPITGDTVVYLLGTDWLSYYGDLSSLKLTNRGGAEFAPSVTFTGKRLRKIKVGGTQDEVTFEAKYKVINSERVYMGDYVPFNAAGIAVSDTPALEEVDARNVFFDSTGVNLSQCRRLRRVLMGGSTATGLILPEGAQLEEVSLPDNLGTLFMRSLPTMSEAILSMSATTERTIYNLYIYQTPNINPLAMLVRLYLSGGNLDHITLVWDDVKQGDASFFNTLYHIARNEAYTGLDEDEQPVYVSRTYGYVAYENGSTQPMTGTPIIEGSLYVDDYINAKELAVVEATWPNLHVTSRGAVIDFEDAEVKRICVENWGGETGGSTGVPGKAGEITTAQAAAVSSVGTNAFRGNTVIVNVDLTWFTGVTTMPAYGQYGAFTNCTALQTVIMPPNLISTAANTFSYCTALKKVIFRNGFKTLANGTFYRGAYNIVLDLPSSLESIASNAQGTNGSLIYVLRGNVGAFDGLKNTSNVISIYVSDEYLDNYRAYLAGNANLAKLHPLSEWED